MTCHRNTLLAFVALFAVLAVAGSEAVRRMDPSAGPYLRNAPAGQGPAAASGAAAAQRPQPPKDSGPFVYQGRTIPTTDEEILDPKHTVLVVHEMINDFISVGGASDKAGRRFQADHVIEPIAKLLAAARASNVRVAYVRWTRHADGSTDSDANRRNSRGRLRAPSNIEGTWGWEGPEPLKPAPGDWVLPKWRQDAFFSTQLDALMRWAGIKTMIITGLGAEVGIVPTVMTASEMGYMSVVPEDAIAPSDPTRKEDALKFLRGPAMIKTVGDIVGIWSKAAPAPPRTAAATPEGEFSAKSPMVTYRGRQVPNTIEEILHPKHTVLLVHEMLNDFISKGGAFDKMGRRIDADATLPVVAKLLEAARAKKVRVAYVRWTNYADQSTLSDPMLQARWARRPTGQSVPSTIEGTWGWQMPDQIKPATGDWVLRKYRPDAFFATPLDTLMRWNGIKTVVIVGVGAEVGVVPTLMTASNLGYFRVAITDALRPTDPARFDDAMRHIGSQATLKTHAEVVDIWRAATPPSSE
jgi:nicotinamidase-related amidase